MHSSNPQLTGDERNVLAWVEVILNFLFGNAGAFVLFWGVFELSLTFAILLAVLAGAGLGYLWYRVNRLKAAGDTQQSTGLRRRLNLGGGVVLGFVAVISTIQLIGIGALPPLSSDHKMVFNRLWQGVGAAYPYFDLKWADGRAEWQAIYDRYLPQVEAAQSDEEYFQVLSKMMAEIPDGHVYMTPSLLGAHCAFALFREVIAPAAGSEALVRIPTQVVAEIVGDQAQEVGLVRGSILVSVEGVSIEEYWPTLDARLISGSSPWQSRAWGIQRILLTAPGKQRTFTFENPEGMEKTVTLVCEAPQPGKMQSVNNGTAGPVITGEKLPSGYGLIRIPTFGGGDELVEQFDRTLDSLMDTPGLIIDLRGNGGGNSMWADQMAGRFFDQVVSYGEDEFEVRLPMRAWRKHWPYVVTPRGQHYTGRVVLLTDVYNMSSAEQFIISLVDNGRAVTVGQRTGGSSGNPISFKLPDGYRMHFSTASFTRKDGQLIEGVGVSPDVAVDWTLDAFRNGEDPFLMKAVEVLGK